MASNEESEQARQERLRRRRERDRIRRQSETPKKEMRGIIYAHQNRISTYNLFRLARRREYDRNRRAALRSRQTESERQESMSTRNEQCRLRRLAESPDERDAR